MSEIKVDKDLLQVFARLHGGYQFGSNELRCRVVQAETDEGHPCEGYRLQVYGVPADAEWHTNMSQAYGAGPHDITFYDVNFEVDDDLEFKVSNYLRRVLSKDLIDARNHYEDLVQTLGPLGLVK